jgi:hypothetical protein
MPTQEQIVQLDANIKARVLRGEEPEEAVPAAVREVGIDLGENVVAQIVEAFKIARRKILDPQFIEKQRALDRQIRVLVRGGMTIARAVVQAQADTGVKLTPPGEKLLIDLLEQESERLSGLGIETVSDEEYAKLVNSRCMYFQQDGQNGWRCCQCHTLRSMNQTHCPCGHERCALN